MADYYFDDVEAARVVDFFERFLCHPKGGSGAPKKFILEPWQKDYVSQLMGWKHRDTGMRRFRTTYLEIPRKNGKTTLSAGILLYMLLVDKENGKEV